MLRTVQRYALVAGIAIGMLGCGDSTAPKSIVGTFTLQTVAGQPLPIAADFGGGLIGQIQAGSFSFSSDKSFTSPLIVLVNGTSAPSTLYWEGTYTVSGSTVILTSSDDGSVSTGTWIGDTFTVDSGGYLFVFER